MKKLMSFILIFFIGASLQAEKFCCGDCNADCSFWCMWYEKDCNGLVESYVAIHFWVEPDGISYDIIDDQSNPEFIGNNMGILDSSCDNTPCI